MRKPVLTALSRCSPPVKDLNPAPHRADPGELQRTRLPSPEPTTLCTRARCLLKKTQELCENGGGRPGLPVPNSPSGLCGRKATSEEVQTELRSCVKVEVAVLGSPSRTVRTVSVDVKQH